ncbi:hypothetical protein ACFX1Z_037548 [Malus domestica]
MMLLRRLEKRLHTLITTFTSFQLLGCNISLWLYGGIRHSKEEYKKWWEEEGAAQLRVKDKRKVLPILRNGDVKFTHANVSFAHKELRYNLQARDRFGDRAKEVCVVVS